MRERFVAIIIGASEWPKSSRLPGAIAFKNSASALREYLMNPHGLNLPAANILNLFDDARSVDEIDLAIDTFLSDLVLSGRAPTDLLVYYTGHGAFVEGDQKYCLLMRSSRLGALGASAYRVSSLARTLNRVALESRKFVIIDACFAGAAHVDFIPQADAGFRMEQQAMDALVDSGTALLCAASSADVALAPIRGEYTMFSGAILNALTARMSLEVPLLSFDDLRTLANHYIRERFRDEGVRPEIHIPDQRKGDISKLRIFPNTALYQPAEHSHGTTAQRGRFLSIFNSIPASERIEAWFYRRRATRTQVPVRHRMLLFSALGAAVLYVVLNPGMLPNAVRPNKCYSVKISGLGQKDGDQLQDEGERPCEPGTLT